MTNLISFFIRRYVFSISIFLAIVFFGLVSSISTGVDLLPNFELPFVSVNTVYSGAGSEEVSKQISEPLEEALATLPGISSISSYSFEGLSVVFIEFVASVNADQAAVDVSQRVNAVKGILPDDAGSPSIEKLDPNDEPILNVAVSAPGEDLSIIQTFAEDVLTPQLRVDGVASIDVIGPVEREIQVLLNPSKLDLYKLSAAQVANAIATGSSEVPIGSLTIAGERILFAGRNKPGNVNQVEEMIVDSQRGLRVLDLAVVHDTKAEVTAYSRLDTEPVILLEIKKQSGANSVATANNIHTAIGKLNLPIGYEVKIINDETTFIASSVRDTGTELVRSVLIVAFIVFLFVGRLGSVFSVVLAIPISFSGALILFGVFGFTFNIITLLAITIAVGLVVDDSIVIAESVDRYRKMGHSRLEAVRKGAGEVSVAVLASTLSLLAVFLPISFLPGILGQFFAEFGLTLAATIIFSYLEALFFLTVRLAYMPNPLPASWRNVPHTITHLANLRGLGWYKSRRLWALVAVMFVISTALLFVMGKAPVGSPPAKLVNSLPLANSSMGPSLVGAAISFVFLAIPIIIALIHYLFRLVFTLIGATLLPLHQMIDWMVNGLRKIYGATLNFLLGDIHLGKLHVNRSNFVLLFALCLFLSLFVAVRLINFNFSPPTDSGYVGITVRLPTGTGLSITNELASRIEGEFINYPEVKTMQLAVGVNSNSDVGNITSSGRAEFSFELIDKQLREKTNRELAVEYEKKVEELLADFPEASISAYSIDNSGPPRVADYTLTLASNDLDLLRERDVQTRLLLETNPYLTNIRSNLDTTISERVFQVDFSALSGTGLTVNDVYQTMRTYNVGAEAATFSDRGNEYPITVKVNPINLQDEQALLSLPIISPVLEKSISLGDLGRFNIFEAPTTISRTAQTYVANIEASVLPGAPPMSKLRADLEEELARAKIIDEFVTEGQDVGLDLTGDLILYTPIAFALAFLLNYLVIASQFNSFKIPVYLLLTVPLALVGALWLFIIAGIGLDVNSVLGIVILTGLVTKNAILLLDVVINKRQQEGETLREMLVRAGKLRLRPILMTTSTLVAISIPLLLGTGDGSEFRRPIGMVIFGGVTSSALLTLFVIPSAFYRFERKRFDARIELVEEQIETPTTTKAKIDSEIISTPIGT